MTAEIIIPSEERKKKKDWVSANLETMMEMIMKDVRHKRSLPLFINMSSQAYVKFIDLLKSKSAYFPNEKGEFNFLTVPVKMNRNLPPGTFTIESFRSDVGLVKQ